MFLLCTLQRSDTFRFGGREKTCLLLQYQITRELVFYTQQRPESCLLYPKGDGGLGT
jgi:hypothetical protein